MQQRPHAFATVRASSVASLTAALLTTLSACGGGGNSTGGTPTATVTAMVASAPKYAGTATVTINGTGLDSTLAVTSSICTNMALQSGSTATTATYTCTVSGGLTGSVIAKSNGTQVGQATLTVPAPIVTMMVNNGLSAVGNILITLAPDKAPKTVDNFLHYVNTGWYNNTIFHRVVTGFVMQGGGYAPQITNTDLTQATLKSGTFAPIAVEATGISNVSGTISMANANTSTNTVTTTSQFFFNLGNNTSLDGSYPAFGSITGGSTVVQAILAAPAQCVNNTAALTVDCLPIPNAVVTSATQTQ